MKKHFGRHAGHAVVCNPPGPTRPVVMVMVGAGGLRVLGGLCIHAVPRRRQAFLVFTRTKGKFMSPIFARGRKCRPVFDVACTQVSLNPCKGAHVRSCASCSVPFFVAVLPWQRNNLAGNASTRVVCFFLLNI